MINAIDAIQRLSANGSANAVSGVSDTTGVFASVFRSAINSVVETDAEKTQAEYLLATGQLDNPSQLTIASTKAELSVSLLVQLRNKALDAYSELTRISL